jgi:hypothetical protein
MHNNLSAQQCGTSYTYVPKRGVKAGPVAGFVNATRPGRPWAAKALLVKAEVVAMTRAATVNFMVVGGKYEIKVNQ